MKKFTLPGVVLVLVLAGVVGIWFATRPSGPNANLPADNTAKETPKGKAIPGHARQQYDPAITSPDPVVTETPPPFRAPKNEFRVEITGRVVNDAGLAVPDAMVRLLGEESLLDATGAGHADAAGRYRLVAFASRVPSPSDKGRKGRIHAQDADGGMGITASVELPAASEVSMPDVVISAAAAIRGRVLDDNGAPCAGVTVSTRSADTHDGLARGSRSARVQHLFITATATTDQRGEFLFKGLRPGKYGVDADRSYHGIKKDTVQVDAPAGGTAVADVNVTAQNYLRGIVRDSDGQPVQGAVVRAAGIDIDTGGPIRVGDAREGFRRAGDRTVTRPGTGLGLGGGLSCVTDGQGRFGWFALRPGKWQISTMVGDSFAELKDAAIGGADHVLAVETAASVSGIVRNAEGGVVEFFDVRTVQGAETVSPFDRVDDDRGFPLRPQGEFRLVNPGTGNRLRFSAPGFVPASLAIAALEPGERRVGLEITLQPLCDLTLTMTHKGTRLDVEPVLLQFRTGLAGQSTTDESGRARFSKLSPASYKVTVIQRDGTKLSATLEVPGRAKAALNLELLPDKQ